MGVKINGSVVREQRKLAGLEIDELAEKAQIKLGTLVKIECAQSYNSNMTVLGKLVRALDLQLEGYKLLTASPLQQGRGDYVHRAEKMPKEEDKK